MKRDGRGASIIVAGVEPYDSPTLQALPELQCIVRCGVGVDSIDLECARTRGVAVLNTPDAPTPAVAELALTLFLALSRNLRAQANSVAARKWQRLEAHLLSGRTVGLIGFGRIGRRVAALCKPFGARVIVADPAAEASAAAAAEVELVTLERLLAEADVVSLHASRAGAAPLQLGARELAAMKRGAVLVNVARGGMVDEAALAEHLRSGHLAGAALDVFAEEPYSGPLCDFENVILTPHSATLTVETRATMELECIDKALRFERGAIRPEERII